MEKKLQGCLLKWRQARRGCSSLGQSVLEYAVLISVVAGAMLAMSFYIKRAVQGRINAIDQQIVAKPNQSPTFWVVPI